MEDLRSSGVCASASAQEGNCPNPHTEALPGTSFPHLQESRDPGAQLLAGFLLDRQVAGLGAPPGCAALPPAQESPPIIGLGFP